MDFNKKYYYLYKITNNINDHFYYGIHSTNNLNDKYMGSGKILQDAYKKYGKQNFTKEIIKFYNSLEELSDAEKEIVTQELIDNPKCYNVSLGGYFLTDESLELISKFNSKNQKGKNNSQYGKCWVYKEDESKFIHKEELDSYLSLGWKKGRIVHFDKDKLFQANKNKCWVHKENDIRFVYKKDLDTYLNNGFKRGKTDKYIYGTKRLQNPTKYSKNKVNVVYKNNPEGKCFMVDKNDSRYISGELIPYNKNRIIAENSKGERFFVLKTDKRLQSGELKQIKISRKKTIGRITVKDSEGNYFSIYKDDPRYLSGELVGVNKGKHWKQKNPYDRSNRKWINKDGINTFIPKKLVDEYLNQGWKLGKLKK